MSEITSTDPTVLDWLSVLVSKVLEEGINPNDLAKNVHEGVNFGTLASDLAYVLRNRGVPVEVAEKALRSLISGSDAALHERMTEDEVDAAVKEVLVTSRPM